MLDRLQKLGEIFHANKMHYCVLSFPKDWEHNDVDILVRSDLLKTFGNVLRDQGFEETTDDNTHHVHYRKDGMHIDIVPVLAYCGRVINGDHVVNRAEINETGLYVPSYFDDFFMSLCHAIFDKDDLLAYESHIRTVGKKAGHESLIKVFESVFSAEKPRFRTMMA
jgi:hypothetical protein